MIDLAEDRLAREPRAVRPASRVQTDLRGEDQFVTVGLSQRAADDLFTGPSGVHVGRVEEVDPGVECLADDVSGAVLVEGPAVPPVTSLTEAHAAKTDARHVESGRPQLHELHLHRTVLVHVQPASPLRLSLLLGEGGGLPGRAQRAEGRWLPPRN